MLYNIMQILKVSYETFLKYQTSPQNLYFVIMWFIIMFCTYRITCICYWIVCLNCFLNKTNISLTVVHFLCEYHLVLSFSWRIVLCQCEVIAPFSPCPVARSSYSTGRSQVSSHIILKVKWGQWTGNFTILHLGETPTTIVSWNLLLMNHLNF